jgi:hypothetical protein
MKSLSDLTCNSDPEHEAWHSTEPLQSGGENENGRSSHLAAVDSAELLHQLNNVFVTVLLNTQVMEWKLPSYSRLKRNLHEVQRDAQRGGELVKQLRKRLELAVHRELGEGNSKGGGNQTDAGNRAVANQELKPAIRLENTTIESQKHNAPVCSSLSKKVPHTPV